MMKEPGAAVANDTVDPPAPSSLSSPPSTTSAGGSHVEACCTARPSSRLATPRPLYESLEPTKTIQHISARSVERPVMRSGFDDKPKVQITSTRVYASG